MIERKKIQEIRYIEAYTLWARLISYSSCGSLSKCSVLRPIYCPRLRIFRPNPLLLRIFWPFPMLNGVLRPYWVTSQGGPWSFSFFGARVRRDLVWWKWCCLRSILFDNRPFVRFGFRCRFFGGLFRHLKVCTVKVVCTNRSLATVLLIGSFRFDNSRRRLFIYTTLCCADFCLRWTLIHNLLLG